MAGQPGTTLKRLQAGWHAAHQPSWPSSIALQQHPSWHGTGTERREQLGRVVHVDVQLKPARLLR